MVKIRLARAGKKNDPIYKIVVIDEKKKNTGKPLAVLGFWHPRKEEKRIDKKEITNWIKKGAQLTPGVKKIL